MQTIEKQIIININDKKTYYNDILHIPLVSDKHSLSLNSLNQQITNRENKVKKSPKKIALIAKYKIIKKNVKKKYGKNSERLPGDRNLRDYTEPLSNE